MSYRYTTIDVIVGVGMCAIVFGALLLFVAATGTFQAPLAYTPVEEPMGVEAGMTMLQPALGQAIVERAILEQRMNQGMAEAATEWNRATLAQHNLQPLPGGPFGEVLREAATIPENHTARVQTVMGRAIVNFTKRGVRSDMLSADQYFSLYNDRMIHMTEAREQRMDQEFDSTFQAYLGHRIVETAQNFERLGASMQERLGQAIMRLTHLEATIEEGWANNQYQLASLIVAAVRTEALADQTQLLAAIESTPASTEITASQEPATLPQIPMGVLISASMALVAIFFGGLTMAAAIRERKAMAEIHRNSTRWVYRVAA